MEIKITEIKKLSSSSILSALEYDIKPLTLIYGKNEKGKTSLVEGLLSAFFPQKKSLKIFNPIREDLDTRLEITLEVDNNKEIFTPNTKNNLEKLLPQGLSRFLFTKAAEVEFASNQNHNEVLTSILSEKNIISAIKSSLNSKGLDQDISFSMDNKEVIAPRKSSAVLKQWESIEKSLKETLNLREKYSNQEVGKVIELQSQQEKNAENFNNKIQTYETEKANFEEEKNKLTQKYNNEKESLLYNIQSQFLSAKQFKKEIEDLKQNINTTQEELNRLKKIEYYKNAYSNQSKTNTSLFYLTAFSILSLTGFTAFLFKSPLLLVSGFTIASVFFIVALLKNLNSKNSSLDSQKLTIEFKKDFKQDLTAATLSTLEKNYNEQKTQLNILKETLQSKTQKTTEMIQKIVTDLTRDFYLQIENADLETIYQEIDRKLSILLKDFQEAKEKINDLIRKIHDTYEKTSQTNENKNEDFQDYEKLIQAETLKHENLRTAFQTTLGIEGNFSWEALIKSLNTREEELIEERKNLIAQVIAAENLRKIISEMEENENIMIHEQLNSSIFTEKLKFFTDGFYTNLSFDNNGEFLITTKKNETWKFQNLSSGAQEQILLAIRFGIVENKIQDGHVFFVLDDAFQFSDYERREKLVQKSVDLVKAGWQILYFSMDNHIAELFDQFGSVLNNSYKKYEL